MEGEDEDNDDVLDSSGSNQANAQMGDQTAGQAGCTHFTLRSGKKTSNIPPKESRFSDLMNGVFALWVQSSGVGKKETEDLSRNEGVKKWLESVEGPETN